MANGLIWRECSNVTQREIFKKMTNRLCIAQIEGKQTIIFFGLYKCSEPLLILTSVNVCMNEICRMSLTYWWCWTKLLIKDYNTESPQNSWSYQKKKKEWKKETNKTKLIYVTSCCLLRPLSNLRKILLFPMLCILSFPFTLPSSKAATAWLTDSNWILVCTFAVVWL